MFNIIKQGIMKRNLKLRTLFVAAFAVATMGLFAQTNGGAAMPGAQADYVNTTTQASTYITEGTTVPAYAVPDPYFHPLNDPWNATPVYTLTAGFTWVWTEGTATLTFGTNNANDNYTTITAPAGSSAGSPYTVNVVETAPAAWGGCSDAGIDLTVNVVTVPALAFSAALLGAPEAGTYEVCNSDIATLPAVDIAVSGGWQNYWIAWSLEVKTVDALGATVATYAADKSTPAALAADYPTTAPYKVITAAAASNDITTVADYSIIGTNSTVYTYTITSINDRASRFGDFIGLDGDTTDESAFTYQAAGGAFQTVTITVHPTPTTGPIFHIDDAWAN
jgi:hypothetical protein